MIYYFVRRFRLSFCLLLLIAVTLISTHFLKAINLNTPSVLTTVGNQKSMTAETPILTGVTVKIFDRIGCLVDFFTANKVIYHATDFNKITHLIYLDRPYLISYDAQNKKPAWVVTAEMGKISGLHQANINLSHQVMIYQTMGIHSSHSIIKTESLNYNRFKKQADTSALITLQQPNLRVKAIGLHADLPHDLFWLKHQVEGSYDF